MNSDEWEKQRVRAVLAAFQTGRPVFGDTDGELRYVDGDREQVADDIGVARQPVPRATALAVRAQRASRLAYVMSLVAAAANGVAAIWQPWQWALVAAFGGCALVWRRVNRHQRDAASRAAGGS